MIYLDTSVALAHLFVEDRKPGAALWSSPLVSSRLLEYELAPDVLGRALEPFPAPVRTLDTLHLAAADFLRRSRQAVALATYDQKMAAAARAIGLELYDPDTP